MQPTAPDFIPSITILVTLQETSDSGGCGF
jgi:hypothetical protein